MLKITNSAVELITNIMSQQGLDISSDVFEIEENQEGFAITFNRGVAPTEIINGLRISYRGSSLEIDSANGLSGLLFKNH